MLTSQKIKGALIYTSLEIEYIWADPQLAPRERERERERERKRDREERGRERERFGEIP
jgi:hypothetical protein